MPIYSFRKCRRHQMSNSTSSRLSTSSPSIDSYSAANGRIGFLRRYLHVSTSFSSSLFPPDIVTENNDATNDDEDDSYHFPLAPHLMDRLECCLEKKKGHQQHLFLQKQKGRSHFLPEETEGISSSHVNNCFTCACTFDKTCTSTSTEYSFSRESSYVEGLPVTSSFTGTVGYISNSHHIPSNPSRHCKCNGCTSTKTFDEETDIGALKVGVCSQNNNIKSEHTKCDDQKHQRTVSFTNIEIRDYSIILGDHPWCSCGPPISLGWEYNPGVKLPVNDYECQRGPRRRAGEMAMDYYTRRQMLMEIGGYSEADLRRAERKITRVKTQKSLVDLFHQAS